MDLHGETHVGPKSARVRAKGTPTCVGGTLFFARFLFVVSLLPIAVLENTWIVDFTTRKKQMSTAFFVRLAK